MPNNNAGSDTEREFVVLTVRNVFLLGMGGTILAYAVFWLRHSDVVVAQCTGKNMMVPIISAVCLMLFAGLGGLVALDSKPRNLRAAVVAGLSVPALLLAADLNKASSASSEAPASSHPVAWLSQPRVDDDGVGIRLISMRTTVAAAPTSWFDYVRMVVAPVSTVARHQAQATGERVQAQFVAERTQLTSELLQSRKSVLLLQDNVTALKQREEATRAQLEAVLQNFVRLGGLSGSRLDDMPTFRADISNALAATDKSGVKALTDALDDNDPAVRRFAVTQLGLLGVKAEPALPKLRALMTNDRDATVKQAAHAATATITHR